MINIFYIQETWSNSLRNTWDWTDRRKHEQLIVLLNKRANEKWLGNRWPTKEKATTRPSILWYCEYFECQPECHFISTSRYQILLLEFSLGCSWHQLFVFDQQSRLLLVPQLIIKDVLHSDCAFWLKTKINYSLLKKKYLFVALPFLN